MNVRRGMIIEEHPHRNSEEVSDRRQCPLPAVDREADYHWAGRDDQGGQGNRDTSLSGCRLTSAFDLLPAADAGRPVGIDRGAPRSDIISLLRKMTEKSGVLIALLQELELEALLQRGEQLA